MSLAKEHFKNFKKSMQKLKWYNWTVKAITTHINEGHFFDENLDSSELFERPTYFLPHTPFKTSKNYYSD